MCQAIQYRIHLFSIFNSNACIISSQSDSTVFSSRFDCYIAAKNVSRSFCIVLVNNSCVTTVVVNGYATCIFNVATIANEITNRTCFACIAIFPNCTIRKIEQHFATSAITIPVTAFASNVNINRTAGITSPMCTIFNPKVYRTKLTRSYTITIVISVFAMPVRIFTAETYTDLAFSAHATISNEVTSNGSFTIACTDDVTIFIFSNIDIYDTVVLTCKFTIRTNCCPSTIYCFDVTATNFNARCYCTNSFISTIFCISYNIHHTIDDNFRFNTVSTIHSFDGCTIINTRCMSTCNNSSTFTIMNVYFTATICKDCCGLTCTSRF